MSETFSPSPPVQGGTRAKFTDPERTATGETRAQVALGRLATLWFNTGTLCNIACANCYIRSSPTNDDLVYLTAAEVSTFLDETERGQMGTEEIGFTGGEPFMNPDILAMLEDALGRGFRALVLTNAMQPLLRPRVKADLLILKEKFGAALCLRVSLDHFTAALHEKERGPETWDKAMEGLSWLGQHGFHLSIAGRTCWGEDEAVARMGYGRLFKKRGLSVDAHDPAQLILFPEMDEARDVPEITTGCWSQLGVDPASMMCASARMVAKRKGAGAPAVLACTLLHDAGYFELGPTLGTARRSVRLNHRHCAAFCVLGGGSCSG